MGCISITSKIKPIEVGSSGTFTANSAKLPPEVLQGFSKVLKSVSQSPVKTKKNELPVKGFVHPPKNSAIPDENFISFEKKESSEHEQTRSTNIEEPFKINIFSADNLPVINEEVPPDIIKKRHYVKRDLEPKITIMSQWKIGDLKDSIESS